jgi:hypothetical protein
MKYLITTPPPESPDLAHKIYDAIQSGSFAVLIVAGLGAIYTRRMVGGWLNSPFAKSLLETLEQLRQSQERIAGLACDVDRLDGATADLVKQLADIQKTVVATGELSRQQHQQILQEINAIRTLLDRRGLT